MTGPTMKISDMAAKSVTRHSRRDFLLLIMTGLTWERNHMSATNVTRHSRRNCY